MAKYCIFCGEELNANAVFCSSCGKKQETTVKKEESSVSLDFDTNSAEEDLLSFLGIMSTPTQKTPSNTVTQPNTTIESSSDIDFQEEVMEDIQIIEEEKTPLEEETTPEPEISELEEDANIIENPQTDIIDNDKEIESIDLSLDEHKNDDSIVENSYDSYDLDESNPTELEISKDENINDEQNESHVDLSSPRKRQRRRQNIEEETHSDEPVVFDFSQGTSILSSISAQNKKATSINIEENSKEDRLNKVRAAKKIQDMKNKRRDFVSDMDIEEEVDFSTTLNEDKNSFIFEEELTADEKATNEKRKTAKARNDIDDEDALLMEERAQLEGRKKPTGKNQPEKRRHSQRDISDRKIYEIEQDESQLEENDDPNYDGYYENVLPIDHDVIKKNKIDLKTVGIILGTIAALALLFYFTFSYVGLI